MNVRNMQPGDRFVLIRTGERYRFIRREEQRRSYGRFRSLTAYICFNESEQREARLHAQCYVKPIIRA